MDDSTKSSIHAEGADIDAGGDVKFIGGNEYKIAGDIINIDVATPSYGAKIENLQKALEANRISLKEDLKLLEEKVRKGLRLSHGEIRALIKDIITSSKNIEKLIPAIKMNGGAAKSLPFESDTVNRINNSIVKGQKEFKEKELKLLKRKLPEAENELRKAESWQLFRSAERRKIEVDEAFAELKSIEMAIERAEKFLAHCERVMKYDEPEIPTVSKKIEPIEPKLKPIEPKLKKKKKEPKDKSPSVTESKLRGTMFKKKK